MSEPANETDHGVVATTRRLNQPPPQSQIGGRLWNDRRNLPGSPPAPLLTTDQSVSLRYRVSGAAALADIEGCAVPTGRQPPSREVC